MQDLLDIDFTQQGDQYDARPASPTRSLDSYYSSFYEEEDPPGAAPQLERGMYSYSVDDLADYGHSSPSRGRGPRDVQSQWDIRGRDYSDNSDDY